MQTALSVPFAWGSCLWNVSPVIASCWTSCKASFNKRFQCCLIVSSYFHRQPSNTNLIQNCCSWLHVTFFVTSTTTMPTIPVWTITRTRTFQSFPATKRKSAARLWGVSCLWPTLLALVCILLTARNHHIPCHKANGPCTHVPAWDVHHPVQGHCTPDLIPLGHLVCLGILANQVHGVPNPRNLLNWQVMGIQLQKPHLPEAYQPWHHCHQLHPVSNPPPEDHATSWNKGPQKSSHTCISDQIDLNLSSQHGTPSLCVQMCHDHLDKNHNMTWNHHHCLPFQTHNMIWNHHHCLSFHRLFQRLCLFWLYWAHDHKKHAEKDDCFQNETSYKHRKTTAKCQHSSSEAPDVWPWPWQNLLTYTLGDLRNLLSGNMIHRVLSQRVLSYLSYQVLSHNIFRDNCCNWTTTTVSVSFGLFRFSAVSVHSVSSVHGAQVHWCWSRTLHTTVAFLRQADFQPPCSLRNLQRKFHFLQKQSTLLSVAKDCLPTRFQKGGSWDHIQRNSYHYYSLHGNLLLTYIEFQIYNPFDRQIIVSCTLQAWRWTRILKTHTVVLDPLLRNDVACSPWVTSQQVLGSPTPTLPTNSCSVLLRWCVAGLSVLDVPVAPMAPPASDPVFTALIAIATWSPSCSPSGSWDSSASAGSSPSSTSRNFPPFPRPLPRPLLPLLFAAGFALGFAAGLGVEDPPGRLLGSLAQQSLAACPDLPQWLHFTGCGHSRAMCPFLPQLWQVMPSEPCFGPVATCTLLSRSLVSLILVWYATTDSQTLATVVAPQWSCTNSATLSGKFRR